MKVVTVGDNCIDDYINLGKATPGGNPVNVAVYLKRMGAEAAYVGVVGDDAHGELMMKAVRGKGVDVSMLHTAHGKTAVTEVEMNGNDRVFGDYYEGVLEHFTLTEEDKKFITAHELVHTGIWGKVDKDYQYFKAAGMRTSFDFADKLDSDLIEKTLPYIDYAFFSHTKEDEFIKDYLIKAHKMGAKVAIATLGENGSLAYDGKEFFHEGVQQVEVVDTMGAGDSYIAGFIYGVLKGESIPISMKLGTLEAAKTIAYFGAWPV